LFGFAPNSSKIRVKADAQLASISGQRASLSSTVALRIARQCAAPAAAWRRSAACAAATLGGARWHTAVLGGIQRCSAALSARGGAAVLGSTWISSDLRRSVAFSGARRRPAPAAARRCSAARGKVALGNAGFGTWWRSEAGARRRAVALGGTP
jgi:hypothetical protein